MSAPFGSTVIPALGMTFAEIDARATALFAEAEAIYATRIEAEEKTADALVVEACDIRRAMFATPPRTPADALAVLNWLAHPEYGLRNPGHGSIEGQGKALGLLRDFMATMAGKGIHTAETPGAGVGNADTLSSPVPDPLLEPASTLAPNLGAAPPQAPYPPKGFTPSTSLRGWEEAGAPIVWREAPSARPLPHSPYTVLDCTIVGPFFLDVIRSDEPEDPEAPFGWAVCRLLHSGFVTTGNATSLEAGKAAAEDAVRGLLAGAPDQPAPVEPGASLSHAGAVEAFRDGYGGALVAWGDYFNADRLEADAAVLAERFRLALADAGPVVAIGDALALAGLLHELMEGAELPDGWSLHGARACMVSVISEALGEMAQSALMTASATPGTPSLPPAASK